MLDLIRDCENAESFSKLSQKLLGMIRGMVQPFARDPMLRRTEDVNSLTNLCLEKLDQARRLFIYDSALSDEHNIRKFMAQLRLYMKNVLIDQVYRANLGLRKPKSGLISINTSQPSQSEDEEFEIDPPEHACNDPYQNAVASEIVDISLRHLKGDSRRVMELLIQGFNPEAIARRTGLQISRVRYLIYSQVQPEVKAHIVS